MKLFTKVLLGSLVAALVLGHLTDTRPVYWFVLGLALFFGWIFCVSVNQAWNMKIATRKEISNYDELVHSYRREVEEARV